MDTKNIKDHKQIGQELELFFNNEISPGAVYWLPKGMVIFKELESYIRELTEKNGYVETSTPIMVKTDLFKQSGHWTKFGQDNMYNLSLWEQEEENEIQKLIDEKISNSNELQEQILRKATPYQLEIEYHGGKVEASILNPVKTPDGIVYSVSLPVNYSLKPMNCPESTILYRFRPRSYRELPLRLSELGRLHRREKSGEVNGLLRVRQLTMDDAHIYLPEEGIFEEISKILDMMAEFYDKFGFQYDFRLATRPEKFAGTEENWKKAEGDLEKALRDKKLNYSLKPEDGAFYGPKIDVHIKDAHDREWQLATVQLDFHMPEAFDLKYIDNKGENKRPVMIHRAIFGSFERFIAILTENFQGNFPVWLSPTQVTVIPISEKHNEYAGKIYQMLKENGVRVEADYRNEKMQGKIRDAQNMKIPYMLILGDKEAEAKTLSVRKRSGENLNNLNFEDFLTGLKQEIASRG